MQGSVAENIPSMDVIDQNISSRLRQRRVLQGYTQGALAEALGVSFQQIQKYETGVNRVSGARLFDLACVLDVPVTYFYHPLRSVRTGSAPKRIIPTPRKKGKPGNPSLDGRKIEQQKKMMALPETLSLVRNFYMLDPAVRRSIASMCRSLSAKH